MSPSLVISNIGDGGGRNFEDFGQLLICKPEQHHLLDDVNLVLIEFGGGSFRASHDGHEASTKGVHYVV